MFYYLLYYYVSSTRRFKFVRFHISLNMCIKINIII